MGYDQKCYDLADAFLQDTPAINTTANTEQLAQLIQDVIEDEIGDMELRAMMPSAENKE